MNKIIAKQIFSQASAQIKAHNREGFNTEESREENVAHRLFPLTVFLNTLFTPLSDLVYGEADSIAAKELSIDISTTNSVKFHTMKSDGFQCLSINPRILSNGHLFVEEPVHFIVWRCL